MLMMMADLVVMVVWPALPLPLALVSGRSSSAITATEPLQKLLNVQQQLYQDQGGQALFAPLLDCHDCHPASSSS